MSSKKKLTVSKEGWLNKEGHLNKNWNKRYFSLSNGKVSYFKDVEKKYRKGIYGLESSSSVVRVSGNLKHPYMFCLIAPGSGGDRLNMEAESEEEMKSWEDALNAAIEEISPNKKSSVRNLVTQQSSMESNSAEAAVAAPVIAAKQDPEPAADTEIKQEEVPAPAAQEPEPVAAPAEEPTPEPVVEEKEEPKEDPTPVPAEEPVVTPAPVEDVAPAPKEEPVVVPVAPKEGVLVLGSSGNVGKATIGALASRGINVKAGIRQVSSAAAMDLRQSYNADVMYADMSDASSMLTAMQGVQTVFINTPGAEERAALTGTAIDACVAAGVEHVVVLSFCITVEPNSIFGSQGLQIEEHLQKSGVTFTVLRVPFFLDNYMGQLQTMAVIGQYYGSTPAHSNFNSIAVADIAEAAATILAYPPSHANKTYILTGVLANEKEVSAAFTAAMGRPVEYMQVPFDGVAASLRNMGMPEWQINGIGELNTYIENGHPAMAVATSDFYEITSRAPMSIMDFVNSISKFFPEIVMPEPTPEPEPAPVEEAVALPESTPAVEEHPVEAPTETPTETAVTTSASEEKTPDATEVDSPPIVEPTTPPVQPAESKNDEEDVEAWLKASATERRPSVIRNAIFTGLWVLKKTSVESSYKKRFIWIDEKEKRLYWSKTESRAGPNKSVSLVDATEIREPATSRARRSSLFAKPEPEGFVWNVVCKAPEPSIDIKMINAAEAKEWVAVAKALRG